MDSLQAVIAELRVFGMFDTADRLERIDAEHDLTVGLYEVLVSLREKAIAELRERLAAAEKKAPPSK